MLKIITLEVKDEILNGEPLYTIKDSSGKVLEDNIKIELKTPIIQNGTEINKLLFDKIDENFEKLKKRILAKDVGEGIYNYLVKGQVGEFIAPDTLNTKYALNEFESDAYNLRDKVSELYDAIN